MGGCWDELLAQPLVLLPSGTAAAATDGADGVTRQELTVLRLLHASSRTPQELMSSAFELLHDGRARGIAEAILWHGGEASPAREAFRQLSSDSRTALLSFVESL